MNKLFELPFGSTLYGTRTEHSDIDIKAVFLPSAREIVLGTYKKITCTQRPKQEGEKNNKNDVDIEIFSLDKFLHLLAEGQTGALDILFGVKEDMLVNWYAGWVWKEILANKDKLLSKDVTSFASYAKTQAAKYGLKGHRVAALQAVREWLDSQYTSDRADLDTMEPEKFVNKLQNIHVKMVTQNDKKGVPQTYLEVNNKKYQMNIKLRLFRDQINHAWEAYGHRAKLAESNEGVDFKSLSHAVRVNSEGIELLRTGHITFPRPDNQLLLDIKTGKMHYKDIAELIVSGQEELEQAAKYSTLRSKPDLLWVDDFVAGVYSEIVNKSHKVFEDWEYKKWSPD